MKGQPQVQISARETWQRASTDTLMHRCVDCWRTKRAPAGASGEYVAVDNGFVRAEQPYPHAHTCPQRGRF